MPKRAFGRLSSLFYFLCVLILLSAVLCMACVPAKTDATPDAAPAATEVPEAADDPAAEATPSSVTLSLALSAEAQAGDLLLAQICCAGESDFSVESGSDWTIIMRTVSEAGVGMESFYKFIQDPAEEPSLYPFLVATGNADDEQAQVSGKILICRGIDPSDPIFATSGETGSGTSLSVDGFETNAPSVIITLFGISDNTVSFTVPENPAGLQTLYNELADGGFVLYASEQVFDSGLIGNRTLAASQNGNWVSQMFSLRLAPTEVTFLAGDQGSLTEDRVPLVKFSAISHIALDQIPAVNAPAGYSFAGWLPKGGIECLSCEEVSQLSLSSGALFTAQYQKITYIVRFLLGEHGTSSDKLVFSGLSYGAGISVPNVAANAGWTFDGWDSEPSVTVKGDAVYTARYTEANYRVEFVLGEHGTSNDTLVFTGLASGDSITVPNVTADEGWTFDGWDTTPVTTVFGDATYTAQYAPVTYTITFDLDGKGTSTDPLVLSGKAIGDSISIPTVIANFGWRFIGWDSEIPETVEGDATFVALFDVFRPK
jgi:hypothetical protein